MEEDPWVVALPFDVDRPSPLPCSMLPPIAPSLPPPAMNPVGVKGDDFQSSPFLSARRIPSILKSPTTLAESSLAAASSRLIGLKP